ncbi:MAG: hypothetical protein A2Y94_11520 [Caldithrix sp. RBG_13_44_9]|nr:MAG: hypothetical protein A2Y94_11520 [Caldithrix sp. RBG_13_44_9]
MWFLQIYWKYIFITAIIVIVIITILPAQQFGPEIIIEGSTPNQIYKLAPVIDLDSQGNLGVSWGVSGITWDTVKFVKSYDRGQTFENSVIVDTLLKDPDAGDTFSTLLCFDFLDNPMVFYWRWVFPYWYFHFYKKSEDGGLRFPENKYNFTSAYYPVDYLFYNENCGFLAYSAYPHPELIVKKSVNSGISFIDSTVVNTGNNYPNYNISLVKCGNGDILCFYTGEGNIYYNRSTDLGENFSDTVAIENEYKYKNGVYAHAFQNHVFIIYKASSDSISPKIIFNRSDDYGYSFDHKTVIYDFGSTVLNSHPVPFIIFNPNVGLCIVWSKNPGINRTIMFTYSTDLGDTFGTPVTVTEGNKWRFYRSMAVSDSGDVYITYINDDNYNIILNKTKLPVISGIKTQTALKVKEYQLLPVYPNPFNSYTQISFKIPQTSKIMLEIYDLVGRRVKTLANETYQTGAHHIRWDGTNQYGGEVTTGIYFVRLSTPGFKATHKILLMR